MAVEVLAPLLDAFVALLAWIAEIFLVLSRSCVRSLRYAFSSTYRQAVRERIKDRGPFYRAAYVSWGFIATAVCLALLGAIFHFASAQQPTPSEACANFDLQRVSKCAQAIREALPR